MATDEDPGQRRIDYAERLASEMMTVGFPRMPARVFAALLITDSGRLTAAELSGMLRASPGAISSAVRYLEQLNVVGREREPGSRRDHYRVYDDVWINSIRLRDQPLLRLRARFQEGADVLGPDTPAGRRMTGSREFFEFLTGEADALIARWQAHRAERDGPPDQSVT